MISAGNRWRRYNDGGHSSANYAAAAAVLHHLLVNLTIPLQQYVRSGLEKGFYFLTPSITLYADGVGTILVSSNPAPSSNGAREQLSLAFASFNFTQHLQFEFTVEYPGLDSHLKPPALADSFCM